MDRVKINEENKLFKFDMMENNNLNRKYFYGLNYLSNDNCKIIKAIDLQDLKK